MNILGVVSASPATVVVGDELHEYAVSASSLAARTGVKAKCVSLPIEYIRSTGNADPIEGWKVASASPTSLGVDAVKDLLSRAGVSIEQVGLVLGDTGTPRQTCPSEAQRIVGGLGVKTAAYDVVGGIGAVPHVLSVVRRWSLSRLPDYVVYVSTNTPSQQVAYGIDVESAGLFGDAAVAILLAKQPAPGACNLRVTYSHYRAEDCRRFPVVIDRVLRVDREALLSREQVEQFVRSEVAHLLQFDSRIVETGLFVAPQLYAAEAGDMLQRSGVDSHRIISGVEDVGFSLGSSHGVALARLWGMLPQGQRVVLMHCGDGRCGSVVLTAS